MKIECKCKNCGDTFLEHKSRIVNGRGVFCSRKCSDEGKKFIRQRITLNCKYCNKQFETTPGRLNKKKIGYNKTFCSDICRLTHIHNNIIKTTCKVCGNEFNTTKFKLKSSKVKFCSKKCMYIGMVKHRPQFEYRTDVFCQNCNKQFNIINSKLKNNSGKFCCKLCYTQHQCNKIANGEMIPYTTSSKKGYYFSKTNNKNFYYESSYELIRMKQLDELNIPWTKSHGIKIEYLDEDGKLRYHIPDFLVNGNIIEEVKPFKLITSSFARNNIKLVAAKKYCDAHNFFYKIITEKELGIL